MLTQSLYVIQTLCSNDLDYKKASIEENKECAYCMHAYDERLEPMHGHNHDIYIILVSPVHVLLLMYWCETIAGERVS